MIDFDEIRKQVAIEHDTLLSKNDPILMTVTLGEIVFQRHVEMLVEKNVALLEALNAAQQQGIAEAKETAGRLITDASNYASDRVKEAVASAMEEGREQIRNELRQARKEVEAARKTAAKWAAVSSLCAAIVVGTVVANVI